MTKKKKSAIAILVLIIVAFSSFIYLYQVRDWSAPVKVDKEVIATFAAVDTYTQRKEDIKKYLREEHRALTKDEIKDFDYSFESDDEWEEFDVWRVDGEYKIEEYYDLGDYVRWQPYVNREINGKAYDFSKGIFLRYESKLKDTPDDKGSVYVEIMPKPLSDNLAIYYSIDGVKKENIEEYGEFTPIFNAVAKEGEINGVKYYIPPWQLAGGHIYPGWGHDKHCTMSFETEKAYIHIYVHADVSAMGNCEALNVALNDVSKILNAGL